MGGSKPPGPVSYVPKPTAPTTVQSVVPEEDFERAGNYISELKAEREATKARRNQMVGSAPEIGQRMKEREAKTEAAYVSSLPAPEQINTGRGIINIDDAAVVRNITSQIVNRRADQAGLRRPDGTKGVSTPAAPTIAKEAKAAPAPKPAPKPAPAPAPAPAPTKVVEKVIYRTEKAPRYPVFQGSSPRSGTAIMNYAKDRAAYERYHRSK